MFRKKAYIWYLCLCVVVISLAWAPPIQAQDDPPADNDNCLYCHENQYYLYDTGKWYCLCEAPMHCIYCHGGRTDSLKEEVAHEGLVLSPTKENAARCQTCHTEDYLGRVVKFASVAGIRPTRAPVVTATPAAGMTVSAPPTMTQPSSGRFEPWQSALLGLLGVVSVALIFFAARCYRLDCLQRRTDPSAQL